MAPGGVRPTVRPVRTNKGELSTPSTPTLLWTRKRPLSPTYFTTLSVPRSEKDIPCKGRRRPALWHRLLLPPPFVSTHDPRPSPSRRSGGEGERRSRTPRSPFGLGRDGGTAVGRGDPPERPDGSDTRPSFPRSSRPSRSRQTRFRHTRPPTPPTRSPPSVPGPRHNPRGAGGGAPGGESRRSRLKWVPEVPMGEKEAGRRDGTGISQRLFAPVPPPSFVESQRRELIEVGATGLGS